MIFDNELEQVRIAKKDELKSLGVNPYPQFLKRGMSIAQFREKFAFIKDLAEGEKKADEIVTLSGRLKLKRVAGKSTFANIEDDSGNIQVY